MSPSFRVCAYCGAGPNARDLCDACAAWIAVRAAALVNLFNLSAIDADATARRDLAQALHRPHERKESGV